MGGLLKNLLLVVSLTFNLVLGYHLLTEPGAPAAPEPSSAPEVTRSLPSPTPATPVAPETVKEAPLGEFAVQDPTLTDYLDYLDLLHAQQLPDEAIKQLLLGAIQEQYEELSARERAASPYWKRAERDDLAWTERELAWEEEQRQLLRTLFGEEAVDDPLFASLFRPLGDSFGFLTADKQIVLHEMLERQSAQNSDLRSGPFVRETMQDRQRANAALTASIQELLTPEEFLEYQLRESRLSEVMRRSMDGFDYTEQEFRDLYQLRQDAALDTFAGDRASLERAELRSEIFAAREASEQRVKEYLGTARYAELQKSQDPLYRSLQAIGARYGNSDAEINAVFEITNGYREQISAVRADSNLGARERQAALDKINSEMPGRIEQVVGSETAQSIQQNVGRLLFSPRFRNRGR